MHKPLKDEGIPTNQQQWWIINSGLCQTGGSGFLGGFWILNSRNKRRKEVLDIWDRAISKAFWSSILWNLNYEINL